MWSKTEREREKMIVCFQYAVFERFVGHPSPGDHKAWVEGSEGLKRDLGCEIIWRGYNPVDGN